jgi:membrane fusion protein, heavy metal efflux system
MTSNRLSRYKGFSRIVLVLFALVVAGICASPFVLEPAAKTTSDQLQKFGQDGETTAEFVPTPEQWSTLTVEPIKNVVFRPEIVTEGKIAVDEDRSTLIFSPFNGRLVKLLVNPGDYVDAGQALFIIEAADSIQAQNDFMAAVASVNKAQSQLKLAQTVEQRLHLLYEGKATALKDLQQAQADLTGAQNDLRTADSTLEATRNRLRILGKTDDEIATFQNKGAISPNTTVYAPIAGIVVQRKAGPGQYIGAGVSDPIYVIGDLSTVWLVAYVRETDVGRVHVGQALKFTVLSMPDESFPANLKYVATSLDANSRRLMVRATINNSRMLLKPEMFASVTIGVDEGDSFPAVPRNAVLYEGEVARVWVAHDHHSIELRHIKAGVSSGNMVQVLEGLKAGDQVVTKGALFIDRAATANQT